MTRLHWTPFALVALGGIAAADPIPAAPQTEDLLVVPGSESRRGVAQDYLVLPSGGELTGQMRFITADDGLAGRPLKFTDLALFGLTGRWSVFGKLDVFGQVELLPKQPSYSSEKAWQSVGFGMRGALADNVALTASGGGGHLIAHDGMWTGESITVEWKKPVDRDFLAFDMRAGVDGLGLSQANVASAYMTELAVATSALFREPSGHWGAWVGIAYAVPVQHTGHDPTTGLAIDPQPRLDFHIGTVLSLVKAWDLYVDLAIIDRGDASNPATELPILDGGFDQKQIMLGVTRHISAPRHRSSEPLAASTGVHRDPG